MTPPEMKTFVADFLEDVWNRGDMAAVDTYVAPVYVIRHDPGDAWDGTRLDRDGFRERLAKSREPFPDQRFSIVDAVAENGRIAVAWRWTGAPREIARAFSRSALLDRRRRRRKWANRCRVALDWNATQRGGGLSPGRPPHFNVRNHILLF